MKLKPFGLVLCNIDDGKERYWLSQYTTERGAIDAFMSLRDNLGPDVSSTRFIVRSNGRDSVMDIPPKRAR